MIDIEDLILRMKILNLFVLLQQRLLAFFDGVQREDLYPDLVHARPVWLETEVVEILMGAAIKHDVPALQRALHRLAYKRVWGKRYIFVHPLLTSVGPQKFHRKPCTRIAPHVK